VSRVHVMLNWENGAWQLINVGRFGTLLAGQSVGQVRIDRDATRRFNSALRGRACVCC